MSINENNEFSISYHEYLYKNIPEEDFFSYIDKLPYNIYYERPATISLLPNVENKLVLDAGCGAGWYTKWLLENRANVTAIDVSENMIKVTKKRVGDKAVIKKADLNDKLWFIEDCSFDLIISSLTLHYIKDLKSVMCEFFRVLKPGGELVFSIRHPFDDFSLIHRETYHDIELIQDEWNIQDKKVKICFYRRPLNKLISPILEVGFSIEKLLEPMPVKELKIELPELYEELMKNPTFIFFKLKKQN